MAIFFTADTHFGHANIIRYCKRPWLQEGDLDEKGRWKDKSIAKMRQLEMDRDLIINWNNIVKPEDTVYHLGDVAFGSSIEFEKYNWQLNGYKIYINGNHDKAMSNAIGRQPDMRKINIDGITIVLSHFALRVWDKSHFNSWHLYGHSHGTLPSIGKSMDVGVDAVEYKPISFEEVKRQMSLRPDNPNWVMRLKGYSREEYKDECRKEGTSPLDRNYV